MEIKDLKRSHYQVIIKNVIIMSKFIIIIANQSVVFELMKCHTNE